MNNWKFSNPGSPERLIRAAVVEDDGSIVVKVVGKENLRDLINSHADECNIAYLVERAVNGDTEVLNQRVGSYGDFTQMPKTYAEMLQRVIDAEDYFSHLDPKIKANFGNDVFKFLAQMDEPDWIEKAGLKTAESDVSKEVKE